MIAASRQTVAGRADRAAAPRGRPVTRPARRRSLSRGQEVREVVLGRDLPARETEAEGLGREHLDLRAVPLEPIWVEVVAHHGGGLLELRLQPWRGVREPLLGRGEAVVAGNE